MKIAILGWGSLLWDSRPPFDHWRESWEDGGPILSIEFSRISKSRLGALTLVIDEEHGTPTRVAWCLSKRAGLDDAVNDLRIREGTTPDNIGRIEVPHAEEREQEDSFTVWARSKGIDAVVWTDLESNFEKKTGYPFSVAAATAYLQALDRAGKAKAMEYVLRSPPFVKTALRSALRTEPGFAVQER